MFCLISNDWFVYPLIGWSGLGGVDYIPIQLTSSSSLVFLRKLDCPCLLREQLSHWEIEFCQLVIVLYFLQFPMLRWVVIKCLLYLLLYSMFNHIIIIYQIYSMFDSSTPDGLAPINDLALIILMSCIGGLSMLWGIGNLYVLLKIRPEGESSQKMQRIFEIHRKILRGAINITKLNIIVGFVAVIIFFIIIMVVVENLDSFYFSLAFLIGAINSILIAITSTVINCLVKPKIINFSRFSMYNAYDSGRKAANFQAYFYIGETVTLLGIFLVMYQQEKGDIISNPDQILKIAKSLVCFSFGSATIAIGSRIINSIYAKGSEYAVETLEVYEDKLRKDFKHPALICKALGEIMNKEVSSVLDSIAYLTAGISVAIYSASYNVIGTDQQGQIVFQLNLSNCYLPLLSFFFSLFYNLIFNILLGIVIRPESGDSVRTGLSLHRYSSTILICGFQALAAYLCLPAQFYIDEVGPQSIKHPYHAYLSILFGVVVSAILSIAAELFSTHPFFLNSISTSCKTGSATNIIYGLSFGYLFNFIPIIFIAGTLFLADYWLGAYGMGLAVVGFLSLLPHYLYGTIIYSSLQNSSYLTYIAQFDQPVIQSLVEASKTKKDYQPHLSTFYNGLVCYFGFQMIQSFVSSSGFTGSTSLKSPIIFMGVLLGAMFPYLFISFLIRSIQKTAPAIPYDIAIQIQEIPGMANGNMDPDFVRTSTLFAFQCTLSLKRFVLVLLGPIVLIGIAGGPALVTGFICGSVISGVQIGLSAGVSGCAWSSVKKQISFNNIRDQQGNSIKPGSDWARAADVGNSIGQSFRDCISAAMPLMLVYWSLQNFVFASIYQNIHS